MAIFNLNMWHKRVTKHSFFRLKQMAPVIPNRITGAICLMLES